MVFKYIHIDLILHHNFKICIPYTVAVTGILAGLGES